MSISNSEVGKQNKSKRKTNHNSIRLGSEHDCWLGKSTDASTLTRYAYERVASGKSMPGVFEINQSIPIRVVIEDILLIVECSLEGEWEGQVRYLPLK